MNPFQAAPQSKKIITLIGIYVGIIVSLMQSSSLSTILPIAAQEIGGADIYPLASSASGVLSVLIMPLFGFLGAKNPALKPRLVCISYAMGCAMLLIRAFAGNMAIVIATGFFYGMVSGGNFVIGYSMIRDMFDRKQAGLYLGLVGTFMSIGMVVGPVLTGVIIDLLGWRMVCHMLWILFAIAGIIVFCGVKITKESGEAMSTVGGKFDMPGAIALMIFLAGFIACLSLGSNYIPFGSMPNTALAALTAAGLVWLIIDVRKKGAGAIIPSTVLTDRNTMIFAFCNFLLAGSSMAVFFFMPSYTLLR
jgi:MFS family permease